MERKAWENLAAARVFLDVEEPCPNAAASRAYYAAYHACWHAMNEAGIPTPEVRSGVYYFLHDPLPQDALEAGVLDRQASEVLDWLVDLRVAADYVVDDLTVELVKEALEMATSFVRRLLGEEPTW
ncbi:HEPN domain-containing protein [Vitiosangium sp. GDMCC 1.1324]|uniref:HEPN domain-containing protein n=1 Tax=Vitiosangium sp. (strain GDMCC 1.1324) TaxID=2138576 RepID=UPI00130E0C93|nr:HEPN domain-containing protein [Vitiosangium sp. GDMCC 1.1324]